MQARIDPPLIPLIKADFKEENSKSIIKFKMRLNLASSASEPYELEMATFENGQPEEFLALLKNSKTAINGTGTMSVSGISYYLRTMLHGEALREFDESASQNSGTTNYHLKFIQEGLLGFPPR